MDMVGESGRLFDVEVPIFSMKIVTTDCTSRVFGPITCGSINIEKGNTRIKNGKTVHG
jgi:hypothetical protein